MAHTRKKDGERKDKKNERMHEAVADRKEHAAPKAPSSDKGDVQPYKPGSAGDANRRGA